MPRHCRVCDAQCSGDAACSGCGGPPASTGQAERQLIADGGGSDDSGYLPIDVGAVVIGLVSIVGGLAVGLGSLQVLYHLSRLGAASISHAVRNDALAFVVIPGVLLIGWFVVGAVLIVGRSRAAPLGAAAFLGATLVNVAVFVTEQGGIRPNLLWYVDPVSAILFLPVNELLYRQIIRSQFLVQVPGILGTLCALLFAGYFAIQSARRYVL